MARRRQQEEEKMGQDDEFSMRDLDKYLEMLYEVSGKKGDALQVQIQGTSNILHLCRNVLNLEQLIQNNTLMGALTRVLQEEFKKSPEITFNILRVFLAFSNFSEMHSLMADYRMGALTMKAIEYEMKRLENHAYEVKERERDILQLRKITKSKRESPENIENAKNDLHKLQKEHQRANKKIRRHEKIMFVAYYILLNLAENISVERKMTKKSLLTDLMCLLDPITEPGIQLGLPDLLMIVSSFLRKLCLYAENTIPIKNSQFVKRLTPFLPCSHPPVVNSILRLLFNLSFDLDIREQMLSGGLVPRLIQLLNTAVYRSKVIKLLYHLSYDDRCKAEFARPLPSSSSSSTSSTGTPTPADTNNSNTNNTGAAILTGLIINFPQPVLPPELGALAINVSLHPVCAEYMTGNKGLVYLMDRLSSGVEDSNQLSMTSTTPSKSKSKAQKSVTMINQYVCNGIDICLLKILRNIALGTYKRHIQQMKKDTKDLDSSRSNSSNTDNKLHTRKSRGHYGDEEKTTDRSSTSTSTSTSKNQERGLWSPHIKTLVEMTCQHGEHSEIIIELLGILGCMTMRDLPSNQSWAKLLRDYGLLSLFGKLLVPGMTQPDVILEVILVLSTAASSESAACEVIANSNILGLTYQLFKDKLSASTTPSPSNALMNPLDSNSMTDSAQGNTAGQDIELTLQLLYLFYRLILNESSREELMYSTRIVADVLHCMTHPHPAMKKLAATMGDLLLEFERQTNGDIIGDMAQQIIKLRFESYNHHWIGQNNEDLPKPASPLPRQRRGGKGGGGGGPEESKEGSRSVDKESTSGTGTGKNKPRSYHFDADDQEEDVYSHTRSPKMNTTHRRNSFSRIPTVSAQEVISALED